ncbi:hypothetical protein ACFE04_024379 [Oxalis oulophora]
MKISKTKLALFSFSLNKRPISSYSNPKQTQSHSKDFFQSNSNDHRKHNDKLLILCEQKRVKEAVHLLRNIKRPYVSLYASLIDLCLQQRALDEGLEVHAHIKKSGFVPGVFICNKIIEMYAKCGSVVDAQKLFDEMPEKDLCSWNTLISGYVKMGQLDKGRHLFDQMSQRDNFSWTAIISGYVRHGRHVEALELYRMMQGSGAGVANKFTVSTALAACAGVPCLRLGKEIHGRIMRTGLDSDQAVWSALSDIYGKCGSLEDARRIFDMMTDRDIVTWTAMIDRYFGEGRKEEGFVLVRDLIKSGLKPNEFTFCGILNACADLTAEKHGKQLHGYMTRNGFSLFSFAASALVHMYSKCGNIENARKVFESFPCPDIVSWTSLILGYAQNGLPDEALKYFELLLKSGTKPDHITFVGILSACTHAGLVDKGLEYFHSIKEKYGLSYTADHYACIVDLLARAGRFEEAEDIINKMPPMKPDRFLWASLLGGCRIHGNLKLAKQASDALFEIEPENPATYVTMANIYATAGKWDEVAKIRKTMDERGIVKKPGLSWTEVNGKVHTFTVGETSHPKSKEIYDFLVELSKKMKEEGYIPDTNFVLHDVEEEQKEQNLSYHSEKLAVAFAIISTSPGTPIKVFKNLRTCVDCHNAIKFISSITDRKITVRDSQRFHYFKDGNCSCKDYW